MSRCSCHAKPGVRFKCNPTVETTEPARCTLDLDGHVSYVYAIVFTFTVSDVLLFF